MLCCESPFYHSAPTTPTLDALVAGGRWSSRFDGVTSVPTGRPVPDAADLRLVAELARSGSIGLPQAAWQAGMSQAEAADRMVTMAQAGLPLRLVAEGDQGQLWQIVHRGPAAPPPGPPTASQLPPPPGRWPAAEQQSGPVGRPIGAPSSPQSLWGIPGTASWAGRESSTAGPVSTAAPVPPPTQQAAESAAVAASTLAAAQGGSVSVAAPMQAPTVGTAQQTVGLSGERVSVTVTEVIDPGSDVLTTAGYRLDDGERAVLVRTTLANAGPASHDCMPDLYLFLLDAAGRTLPKAPVAVTGHPAHRVGVAAGAEADGWTIFLIDTATDLAGVRWCIRPDLLDRTLTWSL